MKSLPRPLLGFPGPNSFVRGFFLVTVLAAVGLSVSCTSPSQPQPEAPPPPVRVTNVGEENNLTLLVDFGLGAKASSTRRFVTVGLQLAPSVNRIDMRDLVLLSSDGQVFDCRGLGQTDRGYCLDPMFKLNLTRKGTRFEGPCWMLAGGLQSGQLSTERPTAVFHVPTSVPISALELSFGTTGGSVPTYPSEWTLLPNDLMVQVGEVSETKKAGPGPKPVGVLLKVKNAGKKPFRLHRGTIQLDDGAFRWPPTVGAIDMTGAAPWEKRDPRPVVVLAPGETRKLGLTFEFQTAQGSYYRADTEAEAKPHQLVFFSEHVVRLADVAPAAPAKP